MPVDKPGDFLFYAGVDEVVEEGTGVFEGEAVWVGKVRKDEAVDFGREGGERWWGGGRREGRWEGDCGEVWEDVLEGGFFSEGHCG